MTSRSPERTRAAIVAVVAAIPEGRVTSYGAIARRLHVPARQVARVLGSFTAEESRTLPWYRVVAAAGVVSTLKIGSVGRRQVSRLRDEGVEVSPRGKIVDFERHFWSPG